MGSKCSTIQLEEEDVREISKDTGCMILTLLLEYIEVAFASSDL